MHTIIHSISQKNSLEDFLFRHKTYLASFAVLVSSGSRRTQIGQSAEAFPNPPTPLKAGYTAHNFRHMQVPNPVGKYTNSFCLITSWVSTIIGSWHICRYMLPKNLNFQHQPRFGQSKPAPETSSLCQ